MNSQGMGTVMAVSLGLFVLWFVVRNIPAIVVPVPASMGVSAS